MTSSSSSSSSSSLSFIHSEAFGEALAGMVGGISSKLCDHPLDTIKCRMQNATFSSSSSSSSSASSASSNGTKRIHLNTRQTIRLIYREDGLAGFYSGIASPLLSNALTKSFRFAIFGRVQNTFSDWYFASRSSTTSLTAKNKISTLGVLACSSEEEQQKSKKSKSEKKSELPLPLVSLAGGIAGAGCCLLLTPLEVTKTRCQTNPRKYPGVLSCFYQSLFRQNINSSSASSSNSIRSKFLNIFRNAGDLYSGLSATLVKEGFGYMWWFFIYESSIRWFTKFCNQRQNQNNKKTVITRDHLPFYYYMLSGCLCGVGFWLAFYPIDSIKTIMQTEPLMKKSAMHGKMVQMNFLETLQEVLFRREATMLGGIRNLYRGCGITLVRALPANGITMLGFELTMRLCRLSEHQIEGSDSSSSITSSGDDDTIPILNIHEKDLALFPSSHMISPAHHQELQEAEKVLKSQFVHYANLLAHPESFFGLFEIQGYIVCCLLLCLFFM